jgi:hypothetical protein
VRQVGDPFIADGAIDQPRQSWVSLQQPAPLRDAVGLVVESFRPLLVTIVGDLLFL